MFAAAARIFVCRQARATALGRGLAVLIIGRLALRDTEATCARLHCACSVLRLWRSVLFFVRSQPGDVVVGLD